MFNPQDMPGQGEAGNPTTDSEEENKDDPQNAEAHIVQY